jgi:hypothetical protein
MSLPPRGIASRALSARLNTAFSISLGSTNVRYRSAAGVDLARTVRKLWPRQKLILTSGFTGEIAGAGQQDEMHQFLKLRKPYSYTEFSREVRAALDN